MKCIPPTPLLFAGVVALGPAAALTSLTAYRAETRVIASRPHEGRGLRAHPLRVLGRLRGVAFTR